jgi:hypothetical protein
MKISERQFTVEELSMFENAKQNSKLLVFGASLSPFFLAILLQLFVLKYSNVLFIEFSKTTIFSFVAFNAWCFGYWYYKKKLNQVHDFKLENQHLKVYDFTITKCYFKPVFQSSDFNFVLKTIDNNFVFLTTDAIDCETLKNQFKVSVFNGTIVEIINSEGWNIQDIEELPSTIFHKNHSQFEIIEQFYFDSLKK